MTKKEKEIRENSVNVLKSLLENAGFKRYGKTSVWKKDCYRFKFNPLKARFEKRVGNSWIRIFSTFYRDLPMKYTAIVNYLQEKEVIE